MIKKEKCFNHGTETVALWYFLGSISFAIYSVGKIFFPQDLKDNSYSHIYHEIQWQIVAIYLRELATRFNSKGSF